MARKRNLGDQLREARRRRDHTQLEAALAVGCRPETWARWEAGRHRPMPTQARRLRAYLDEGTAGT